MTPRLLLLALLPVACAKAPPHHAPAPEAPPGRDEGARIEALLRAVSTADVTFIRNGSPHEPKEAEDHLRTKWKRAGRTLTAEQFIENIASKSSMSGKPYLVRLADGKEIPSADWFRARLVEIDAAAR